MRILKNILKSELNIRIEKDFPIKGIEFIDINSLVIQKNAFNEITNLFVEEIGNKKVDYIISPEARGFLFGCPVANKLNVGFIPIRKKGKLPPTTVEAQLEYEKEYGTGVVINIKELNNDNIFSLIDINEE